MTLAWAQRNGIFFALVLATAFFSIDSPRFLTRSDLTTILLQVSIGGIIAVPGAMLVLAGYVDLSVGSVMALSAVVFGTMHQDGLPLGAAVAIGLAAGLGWGLLNGFLIAGLGFSPIVVTLGGLAAARGAAEAISQGQTVTGFGTAFDNLGNGTWLGYPIPIYIFVAVCLIGAFLWYQTPLGRYLTAIGSSAETAQSMGIGTRRITFRLYAASGLAAGLGGLILTAQLDGSSLSIGQNMELTVLTAILLGGVSFLGGRGTLFGVICGVLFLGVIENGLILIQVGIFYQDVAVGAALIGAAGLDVLYRRLDRIPIERGLE
jgi:ribose transport system permease protein